jgi:hypothetical protein
LGPEGVGKFEIVSAEMELLSVIDQPGLMTMYGERLKARKAVDVAKAHQYYIYSEMFRKHTWNA